MLDEIKRVLHERALRSVTVRARITPETETRLLQEIAKLDPVPTPSAMLNTLIVEALNARDYKHKQQNGNNNNATETGG